MTEKRFILINCTKPGTRSNILDYQKKHNEGVGDELWLGEVVDMLNQLTGENEQLKKENKHLRCTIESNSQDDYIDYLEKQNERLKERIEGLASNDKIVFMVNE